MSKKVRYLDGGVMNITGSGPPGTEKQSTASNENVELPVSLRDWFCGQVLGGLRWDINLNHLPDDETYLMAARHCHFLADAMLEERKKKES